MTKMYFFSLSIHKIIVSVCEMAQYLKCLLFKHENVSSDPQHL